jgi:hypothetical protein
MEMTTMKCVAPGCQQEAESETILCENDRLRVERSMADHKDDLLELMVEARAEFEKWLESPWRPAVEWVICQEDHMELSTEEAVNRIVDDLFGKYSLSTTDVDLGWTDPVVRKFRAGHNKSPFDKTCWRIVESSSGTLKAWREHLKPYLIGAFGAALETFSLEHAGREIKAALLQQHGYGPESNDGAMDEVTGSLLESSKAPFSDDADIYVRLKYDDDPGYMFHPDAAPDIWWRYPVLPTDVMAILDAVKEYEREHN